MGITNVDAMLAGMTAKCFYGWMAYDALEPFGERRQDYRTASIVTALWNIARDTKKHPDPFKYSDFVIDFEEKSPEQLHQLEQERLINKMKAFTAILASQADTLDGSQVRQGTKRF